jgi:competence ComEA-like helix-hairpin-helix protein
MKKLKHYLRNYFSFTQKETNGFIALSVLILLAWLLPFLYSLLLPEIPDNSAADAAILQHLVASMENKPASVESKNKPSPPIVDNKLLFDFNPNLIDETQWESLGLPKYMADRIIKYRQKGGKFKIKRDLLKIYGFPPALYEQLYAHILLPDTIAFNRKFERNEKQTEKKEFKPFTAKKENTIAVFNLNRADTTQFKQLKGIGSALSKRIVKYRDLLGGFISKEQIREVYGLDSTVIHELFQFGYLEENAPFRKLNVNTASVQELDAHPYISPKIANIIVSYRQQHGKYTSIENLYNIRVLDKATLEKLTPYLSFE